MPPAYPFASPAHFDDQTRLYAIRIAGHEANEFQVVDFSGEDALSDLFRYRLHLVSTQAGIALKSLVGRQASLSITLADGSRIERSGYVQHAARLESDGGLTAYRIELVPWFWLATQTSHNRVFQDKTALEIFDEVVAIHAPRVKWRTTPEVEQFLADVRPRSYCVQYRESDYDFLARLLAEEGLGFCFLETGGADAPQEGKEQNQDNTGSNGSNGGNSGNASLGATPQHELVIFADSVALPEDYSSLHQNGGRGIRYHRASSQESQDAIQVFGGMRRLQPAVTTLASYDYKAKGIVSAQVETHHAFAGKTLSAQSGRLDAYDHVGPYAFASRDEAEHYALISREAYEARHKTRLGQGSVRTFRPGLCFDLTESALDSQGEEVEKRFLLTALAHAGRNNLPKETLERVARLIDDPSGNDAGSPAREADELVSLAAEHGYANRFEAIRADVPWRPVLADETGARFNPRPTAQGVQTALVVGPNGETRPSGADELYTDKLGRVKVRFHWQQGETDQDRNTCWLRVAQRQAGPGYGAQWIPRIGQEVLIGFLEGDIDRPIVLGALYNGQGEAGCAPSPNGEQRESDTSLYQQAGDHRPSAQGNQVDGNGPAWHAAAPGDEAHRNAGALSGFKTKEFGGQGAFTGYNQLVFDDSDGQLRTQLATTQANTQLNLGHLIHQADNYRGSFRGTGYEVRTDAYGAIRAAQGILLTTYGLAAGAEPAGDISAAIALSKQAQNLVKTFSQAAGTHQTVKLSGNEGSTGGNQSALDDKAAPLPALVKTVSGMVEPKDLEQAKADAANKNTSTSQKLPHTADPIVAVAAKAGLGLIAGQSQHWANGENLHWQSGEDTNLAIGNQLRIHTGQAIGMLAGAIQAGQGAAGTGLSLIAAEGKIDVQAQADTLQVQAKDEVNVQSANAHIDWAAAKAIKLKVAGGACIDISGGNITVKCPGTITVHASQKSFSGPDQMSYPLAGFPDDTWNPAKRKMRFALGALPGQMTNYAGEPFKLYADRALLQKGLADDDGALTWDHKEGTKQYKVELESGASFLIDAHEKFASDPETRELQLLSNNGYRSHEHSSDVSATFDQAGDAFRKMLARSKT